MFPGGPALGASDALRNLTTTRAFAMVCRLKSSDTEAGTEPADMLTHLYVRIAALQALATLIKRSRLRKLRIRQRLTNLRTDLLRVVAALSPEARK